MQHRQGILQHASSVALLNLKLVTTFPVIESQILFRLLFRETHRTYGLVSLFSRTCLALGVCLNAFSSCFAICALTRAGITA